jgi:hypothetical protein
MRARAHLSALALTLLLASPALLRAEDKGGQSAPPGGEPASPVSAQSSESDGPKPPAATQATQATQAPKAASTSSPPRPPVAYIESKPLPDDNTPTKMASPLLFGLGLTLAGTGFVTFFVGLGFRYSGDYACAECALTPTQNTGLALMIGGGLGFGFGAAMVAVGARQVPDKPAWASALPSVSVGPTRVDLRWEF